MQLLNAAKQIDYYPLTSAGKGFVRRVTWHPGCERTQMVTFATITKSDMVYDVNQYIANGATVTDFNLEAYQGSDYSPMACWFHKLRIKPSTFPTMTPAFSGVFLTVENHGCIYTVSTEGELFYAPMYQNGTVNVEEFDMVDFWESDADVEELEEIQFALIDMMKRVGLYFQQSMAV